MEGERGREKRWKMEESKGKGGERVSERRTRGK